DLVDQPEQTSDNENRSEDADTRDGIRAAMKDLRHGSIGEPGSGIGDPGSGVRIGIRTKRAPLERTFSAYPVCRLNSHVFCETFHSNEGPHFPKHLSLRRSFVTAYNQDSCPTESIASVAIRTIRAIASEAPPRHNNRKVHANGPKVRKRRT